MPDLAQRLNKPEYLFRPRQLLRRLRALRQEAPGENVFRLPWGTRLEVDPRENIGRAVWHLGLYDLVVSEALWRLTAPGETALDVGANLGHMTSLLAARVGPRGRVIAFEPHPALHARLQRNAALWREDLPGHPVELRAVALGDTHRTGHLHLPATFEENTGTASLLQGPEAPASPGPLVPVEVRTLDAELPPPLAPSVMKLDIEGGELAALRGASRLLSGSLRDLVFEEHATPRSPVLELLSRAGYTLFGLRKSLLGPTLVPPDRPLEAGSWEAPSFLATRAPVRARALLAPRGWRVLGSRVGGG